MPMHTVEIVEIVEIQGRAAHGVQEPFQCLGEDGHLYYVKGRQTDRASLCNEWVCAHLGAHLGLPIPPFRLVHVSDELLTEAPTEWKSLGVGLAFGSRRHSGCTWFNKAQTQHISDQQQIDILAFDWWIRNSDRNDGNPNLLWDTDHGQVVVIDHNLAFPHAFNAAEFCGTHVFRAHWPTLDLAVLDALQQRFCVTADAILAQACDNVPKEWEWANSECDIPSNMNLDLVKSTVLRCKISDFWRP